MVFAWILSTNIRDPSLATKAAPEPAPKGNGRRATHWRSVGLHIKKRCPIDGLRALRRGSGPIGKGTVFIQASVKSSTMNSEPCAVCLPRWGRRESTPPLAPLPLPQPRACPTTARWSDSETMLVVAQGDGGLQICDLSVALGQGPLRDEML